jgi:uncharacterized membrane protein YhfC
MITRPRDKLYWGYVDYEEKIHVKVFKSDRAIRNAQDSGTTIGIFDPFYAANIEEATHAILEKWREQRVFMKKEAN